MTSLYQRTPQDVATGEGHEDIAEYLKKAVSVYMRLYCLKLISTAESVHTNRLHKSKQCGNFVINHIKF